MQIGTISSLHDVVASNGTDSLTPDRRESWSNSTSVTSKPTEPKLQLKNIGEFRRTVDKNITFVSNKANEFNSTNHMPHAKDQRNHRCEQSTRYCPKSHRLG